MSLTHAAAFEFERPVSRKGSSGSLQGLTGWALGSAPLSLASSSSMGSFGSRHRVHSTQSTPDLLSAFSASSAQMQMSDVVDVKKRQRRPSQQSVPAASSNKKPWNSQAIRAMRFDADRKLDQLDGLLLNEMSNEEDNNLLAAFGFCGRTPNGSPLPSLSRKSKPESLSAFGMNGKKARRVIDLRA